MRFQNREQAGRLLAERLAEKYARQDGIVYALPRGGVVLGAEVARRLDMPLDVIIVRKIGHPYNSEYAIGALTETGDPVVNPHELARLQVEWFNRQVAVERTHARRQRQRYVGGREPLSANGKLAIIIDDGIATGLSIKAAIEELLRHRPQRLVVVSPVIPVEIAADLRERADDVVAIKSTSDSSGAVSSHYEEFPQITDDEAIEVLRAASTARRPGT
jgi:putative phosphoribosyl transferase